MKDSCGEKDLTAKYCHCIKNELVWSLSNSWTLKSVISTKIYLPCHLRTYHTAGGLDMLPGASVVEGRNEPLTSLLIWL